MPRRKHTTPPDAADSGPSFEDALAGLEAIVETMEHGQLPLEDLVANYEQGSSLLKHCESILTAARNRIELITLRNQNQPPSPANPAGDPPATLAAEPTEDVGNDDDDIRLF